jgi:hypothetical protein
VGLIVLMVVGSVRMVIITLLSHLCDHGPSKMTAALSSLTIRSQICFSTKGSTGNAQVDAIETLSASAEGEAKSISATAKIRSVGVLPLGCERHRR